MATVTIPKIKIEKAKGVVILPLREYERLIKNTAPTYYLRGASARKLDALVSHGLAAHKARKTKIIRSLAELR